MKQYAALDDTLYFWFAANDTSGSGGDGASPTADVRLAGAAAAAAPVYSPTPILLTHANYPAGAHEIAIAATAANGFAADNTYAVFCTLAIDSQNPTGFVGSFDLKPVESNLIQIGDTAQSATDLKDFADAGYDPSAHRTQALIKATDNIDLSATQKTSVNTEVDTALADIKLDHLLNIAVDTDLPTTVHDNSVLGYLMATSIVSGYARATDAIQAIRDQGDIAWISATGFSTHSAADIWTAGSRALSAPNDYKADVSALALASVCTEARLAELAAANVPADIDTLLTRITAAVALASVCTEARLARLDATVSSRSSHTAANVWSAAGRELSIPNNYKADVSSLALEATLTAMKGATFAEGTDSLEAIRDRGDAAWTTGAGGSDRLLMIDTTIATLASQTSFTLTAGSADDGAYNNCTIVIEDASTPTQKAVGLISSYVGATKTITLKYDPAIFTMAVTDKIYILAENALKSTLANRQLNVAADGDIAGDVDGSVASLVGHTAQTGDSFARLGATGSGLTSLAQAAVCTETRLAELAAANLPADIDAILADVTGIAGAAMRGTDSAALASVCTDLRLAELDAANLPTDIATIDANVDLVLADTGELQTDWTNGGRLDLLLDAVKVKTDNLPSGLTKNEALSNFSFLMTDSTTNEPKAGLTVTVQISKDGSAFANATNTPATEISNGAYKINLTQAERNADVSLFKATAAGANQTTLVLISTS